MNALLLAFLLAATSQLAPAGPAVESSGAEAPLPPTQAAEAAAEGSRPYYQDAGAVPLAFPKTPEGDPVLRATIKADHDVVISAEAEGTLIDVPVREGARVAEGQTLATIDDRQAQAARTVADISHKAALARASDDVERTFAIASAKFAEIDLRKDLMANQSTPGAVTDIQIEQKKLALKRAQLQIEKAVKDLEIAAKEADVKKAELSAAEIALAHRQIKAPFAGEVVELVQKEAQWVKPGDPILRLVQFEKLRVDCFAPAWEYDPADLANRRVTVVAHLARGRKASAEGRVVFVDQTVLLNNTYRIRAEVDNQKEGDFWLLRPGQIAEITIHSSEGPLPSVEPRAARQQ
jgi:macrolide-specific efflux system membrane fusion protein